MAPALPLVRLSTAQPGAAHTEPGSPGAGEALPPHFPPPLPPFSFSQRAGWWLKSPDLIVQPVLHLETINIQAADSVISLSAHPPAESDQGQHFW